MNINSFTSASGDIPWKLLQHCEAVTAGMILPVHLQLIPTNRCNGNCSFCSCSNDDRTLELSFEEVVQILDHFELHGSQAVTFTGGGEPTIHPRIEDILHHAFSLGYDIGLVTNGKKWGKDDITYANDMLLWLRVSVTDTIGDYDETNIINICKKLPDVDCSISFTVCEEVNVHTAAILCEIANVTENITHIRFVVDIMNAHSKYVLDSMNQVIEQTDSPKAIYQFRDHTTYTRGMEKCRISKLKPLVGADGYVYPCCGVQYASFDRGRLPKAYRMCHWKDFTFDIDPFNGIGCDICYYNWYNYALNKLTTPLKHRNHI